MGVRSRWRAALILAAALAVVAIAGVTLRSARLPHWRPALGEGERYGIDVSGHQGLIDWRAVAADDIDFAYIKASEGGDFVDDMFARNWREAAAAGVDRGAYHFFTLT